MVFKMLLNCWHRFTCKAKLTSKYVFINLKKLENTKQNKKTERSKLLLFLYFEITRRAKFFICLYGKATAKRGSSEVVPCVDIVEKQGMAGMMRRGVLFITISFV